MTNKKIETGCHGIVVELIDETPHSLTPNTFKGGSITSDLKEVCSHCEDPNCDFDCPEAAEWTSDRDVDICNDKCEELENSRSYNHMMDALESMILAHACAGIDITTPAYLEGIETACNACAKATE